MRVAHISRQLSCILPQLPVAKSDLLTAVHFVSLLLFSGHPNIVGLQDVYETPVRIFMVQELCTGRTLLDVIRAQAPMREELAATLFRGIIKSVLHCHQVRDL